MQIIRDQNLYPGAKREPDIRPLKYLGGGTGICMEVQRTAPDPSVLLCVAFEPAEPPVHLVGHLLDPRHASLGRPGHLVV